MNLRPALAIVNKAQLSEPIHEKTDSRAGCAYHLCERLLTHLGDYSLGLTFLAEMSKQKKNTGESFLAGIEELVTLSLRRLYHRGLQPCSVNIERASCEERRIIGRPVRPASPVFKKVFRSIRIIPLRLKARNFPCSIFFRNVASLSPLMSDNMLTRTGCFNRLI
jgi:hypothetical protein